MRRLPLVLFFLFFAEFSHAAGTVSGQVFDEEELVPIEGVEVLVEGSDFSVTTDEEGRFRLPPLPEGRHKIVFQSSKHERKTIELRVGNEDLRLDVELKAANGAVELAEVSVTARREPVSIAKQSLSRTEIMTAPGSASDAIRVIESLPGVASLGLRGYEAGGLVIRGSSPEDSGYYLDGFLIPQLFHFGGLQTVVNSEWLDTLDYYAGGYSVRYGNAMGGIVEINTRSSNNEKFSGVVDLTNYASFVLVEGPAGEGGRLSGGASVRRTVIDYILPEILPEDQAEFTLVPRFYDYQVELSYRPNAVNSLRLFAFGSDDRVGIVGKETDDKAPTGTQAFEMEMSFHRPILSWTFTPSPGINNRLSFSPLVQTFRFEVFGDKFVRATQTLIEVRDDFTADLASWNTLSLGFLLGTGTFDMEADILRPPKEGDPSNPAIYNELSILFNERLFVQWTTGYLEDSVDLGSLFRLTPGVHVSMGTFRGEDGGQSARLFNLDPRLFGRLRVTEKATLKASVGQYQQFPQGDELVEPFGTLNIESERAIAYGLGGEYDFGHGYTVDLQAYYKQLDNLVARTPAESEEPYNNKGVGKIYGVELLARKTLSDRLYGWLSYTYSVSRRRDQPGEDWRYFDLDQRHNIILLASYRLGETWRVGARFAYATGLPFTEVDTAIYNSDTDSYIPLYSEDINAVRDKDLHQLDLRVDKIWNFKHWQLTSYLDVQNVYLEKQPVGYIYNYDYTEKEAVSFPTFYPTLGVAARW